MYKFGVLRFCFSFQALVVVLYFRGTHAQLSTSESRTLLQIQKHLEYPEALKGWSKWTNFCYLPPSPSVTVVCSGNHVTELTIVGAKNSSSSSSSQTLKQGGVFVVSKQSLSESFSIDSLFTAVTRLSGLKRISLVSLGLWGPIPSKISRLSSLQVLNISSNFMYGSIPPSIASLKSLQSLVLSNNLINGSVPDLSGLESLQEIDLGSNRIGPEFPSLGSNLVYIKLQSNSFRSSVPSQFNKFYLLQWLDVSSNHLVGPIPSFVFSLPALWYLDLSGNQLTGAIPKGTICGGKLWVVNISSNFLIGNLPTCIGSGSSNKKVFASWNCLSAAKNQHVLSYCQRQALAVKPPGKHHTKKEENQKDSALKLGIVITFIAGIVVVVVGVIIGVVAWYICSKRVSTDDGNKMINKPASERTSARVAAPSVNSKYMPRTLRMPALSLPSFHDFTLEELQEATNGFDPENLVRDDGVQGQIYKGLLGSGSTVLIKSIKLKQKHSAKSLNQHMEVISQLRHQNLVSVVGHCVVMYQDKNNKGATIFVVLEDVANGSLRDHLTDWRRKEGLKWPQRMTISMGIARGVHFLHTGTTPRIFGNDLKTENVLLDESLTPKVSSYRIPLPPKEAGCVSDTANAEKDDIYKLGAILIELLTGKQVSSESELDELKQELESSLGEPAAVLQQAVDSSLRGTFAHQSLRTAVEITINCLNKDPNRRPSMEDVLWHLQYSIQVQQTWTSSGNLGLNSGNLGMHLQK